MEERFRREFLGWDRPALPEAARRLLDRGDDGSAVDLTDIAVVVPGSRAGRRLQELLAEGAAARGRPLRPPRIVTIGRLPELLYRPTAPPPPRLRARLTWAAELASLPAVDRDLLLSHPPEKTDLPAWLAFARQIEALHRELGSELLSFADVAERFGSGAGFDDALRWRVLAGLQKRVGQRLRSAGWEDVDAARRTALRGGLGEEPSRFAGELWLVAASELPRVAARMLSAFPGSVRVLIHAPEAEAESFGADGTLRPDAWMSRPLDPGSSLTVGGGPTDQADRCLRFLAGLEGAYGPDEIVVGAPDAEVVPLLSQRLDLGKVPHRVAEGRPLSVTAPYLLLRAIARHLRDGLPGTLAELVRHPDLERWLDGGAVDAFAAIRALDAYREAALPADAAAAPLPGGPKVRGRHGAEAARRRIEELLGGWRRERPLAQWAGEVVELIQAVYGDRVLEEGRREDRDIETFAREVRRVLDELEEGPEEGDPVLPGHVALHILLDELNEAAVPAPRGEAAVEILGWLELHLDDAPVVMLTGVNDGHLPRSEVSDVFLPDGLRTSLEMPDHRARRARDAYRLLAILHSGERVLLTAGRRTGSGDPLRPSPLLLQGPPEEMARRILRHYGESHDHHEADEETNGQRRPASRDIVDPLMPPLDRTLSPPEAPLRIPVTAFALLLEDPYRWLLVEEGGSAWIDDERREMDPLAFGRLAHDTLEALGRELRREMDADRLANGLVSRLRDEVRDRYGTRPLPSVRIQVAQLQSRLEALARVEAGQRRMGWETVAVEVGVPTEGVPFPVDGDTVFLRGRVDRVDRHPELGWRLLDYKTSERPQKPDARHRRGREKRWVDLQLPLYRHLASYLELDGLEPGDRTLDEEPQCGSPLGPEGVLGLGYYNLPRALDGVGVEMARWTSEELASADEAARAALRRLLAGDPLAPDPDAPSLRPDAALAPLLGEGILRGGGNRDGEEGPDA